MKNLPPAVSCRAHYADTRLQTTTKAWTAGRESRRTSPETRGSTVSPSRLRDSLTHEETFLRLMGMSDWGDAQQAGKPVRVDAICGVETLHCTSHKRGIQIF